MSQTTALKQTLIWGTMRDLSMRALLKQHNITTGKVYHSVITKERQGAYLGGTVQVIPHITDEIKQKDL